jgi:peptidoglycan/xylan/chitin deacetylase (PgdA/CDA1 family)
VSAAATPTASTPTLAAVATVSTIGPTAVSTTSVASGAVALTFDAGADRGYAEDILDILLEQHVTASFGITGQWAKANADLVRRMAADGHLVFNHTLDHRSFTGVSDRLGGLSAARRRAELDDADAIIAPLLGHSTRPFYRLPYGDDDAQVAADVLPAGYSHKVGWTIDSLGWRGSPAGDIVARCLKLVTPSAVYVFHVGRASQDELALPRIINGLRDKGFGFRRVDQA